MTHFQRYQILLQNGATYKVLTLDHPPTKSGLAALEKLQSRGWEAVQGCFPYDADEPVGEQPIERDFDSAMAV